MLGSRPEDTLCGKEAPAPSAPCATLRPDVPLVLPGALPVLGDVLRHTVAPPLGWLQMPLLKWAMFSPARVPARFQAEYSPAMALRPSQIRATAVDGALMVPGALALRGDYKNLALPVVIIAGDGADLTYDGLLRTGAAGPVDAVHPDATDVDVQARAHEEDREQDHRDHTELLGDLSCEPAAREDRAGEEAPEGPP